MQVIETLKQAVMHSIAVTFVFLNQSLSWLFGNWYFLCNAYNLYNFKFLLLTAVQLGNTVESRKFTESD
jgi:hypothetical protein